jgi:hypothetical protein
MYFKCTNFESNFIKVKYIEEPLGHPKNTAYWQIDYGHHSKINYILSHLIELKAIMGLCELEFSYYTSQKEYYTQTDKEGYLINWLKI